LLTRLAHVQTLTVSGANDYRASMALTARMVTVDRAGPVAVPRFWTGATGHTVVSDGKDHAVPADPEGNEFCVAEQD